jgi:hypothetical protein
VRFACVEVNRWKGILITIKTVSEQRNRLSSVLLLIATEPLNRSLATAFLELMYASGDGVLLGPILCADAMLMTTAHTPNYHSCGTILAYSLPL